jgi:hypothetical protein
MPAGIPSPFRLQTTDTASCRAAMQPCTSAPIGTESGGMIVDLRRQHQLVRIGLLYQRFQSPLDGVQSTNDGISQRLLNPCPLHRRPVFIHVVARRRRWSGRAASQADELLLQRCEETAPGYRYPRRRHPNHDVRLLQPLRRLNPARYTFSACISDPRSKSEGEGKRQTEHGGELRTECARPNRHTGTRNPAPGTARTA